MHKGECLRCGQCCSSFYVKMNNTEILKRAQVDESKGLSMLESDAVFISKHCIPLSPEEARLRSPEIVDSPYWSSGEFWTCSFHRSDRLCQLDVLGLPKPHICRGYPWYGVEPRDKWLYPGCGYRLDLIYIKMMKGGDLMAKIKIIDLPQDMQISKEEMKKVFGGATDRETGKILMPYADFTVLSYDKQFLINENSFGLPDGTIGLPDGSFK